MSLQIFMAYTLWVKAPGIRPLPMPFPWTNSITVGRIWRSVEKAKRAQRAQMMPPKGMLFFRKTLGEFRLWGWGWLTFGPGLGKRIWGSPGPSICCTIRYGFHRKPPQVHAARPCPTAIFLHVGFTMNSYVFSYQKFP